MEQLILELATPEPPAFANFVAGPNRGQISLSRVKRKDIHEDSPPLFNVWCLAMAALVKESTVAATFRSDQCRPRGREFPACEFFGDAFESIRCVA